MEGTDTQMIFHPQPGYGAQSACVRSDLHWSLRRGDITSCINFKAGWETQGTGIPWKNVYHFN